MMLAVIAVAVLGVFWVGFGNTFVEWDDVEYVKENPYLINPTAQSLRMLWQTPIALNYHPLTMTTMWLNARLFGVEATSFIVGNVLIHILNTLLVFELAKRLSGQNRWVAFFTALLWGIHPMHVESVVWVSERKDVLYVCFFLLACLSYLRYRPAHVPGDGPTKPGWLWVTLVLLLLACLAKAMAVVLPIVLLLIDFLEGRNPLSRKSLLEKLPLFALALFFGVLALNVQAGGDFHGMLTLLGSKRDAIGQEPFAARWLVYGSYGFMLYVLKLFVPYHLTALYPYPDEVKNVPPSFWIGPLFFGATLVLFAWAYWQRRRLLAFALGFFIVTIFLVLQFMTVGAVFMAERYSYLPYFGLVFGLVWGIEQYLNTQATGRLLIWRGALIGFALLCAWLTVGQVKTWANTETLWMNALQYTPDSDQIHECLGDYYGKRDEVDKAQAQFEAAVQNGTNRFHVYEGLGNVYGLKKDDAKAIAMYDQALRMDSSHADLHYNRAITVARSNPAAAVPGFTKALQLEPWKDTLYIPSRAFARLNAHQFKEAAVDYSLALQKRADVAQFWHNRGVCRYNLLDRAGAIADITKAIALQPGYEEAKNNLKAILADGRK